MLVSIRFVGVCKPFAVLCMRYSNRGTGLLHLPNSFNLLSVRRFFCMARSVSKRTLYGVCVFVTMEMKNLYDFMGFTTKSSKLSLHLQCGSP